MATQEGGTGKWEAGRGELGAAGDLSGRRWQ
jgi:hypothetical protein